MPTLQPTAYSRQPRGRGRRGITLLEVLISMFVLLVGLLGVASLIPVGKFEMQRGAKIDRAGACGRAAMRDIKVQRIMNPTSWALANASGARVNDPPGSSLFNFDATTSTYNANFRAFAIDPLGVGDGDPSGTTSLGSSFPWPGNATTAPAPPLLPRLTLGPGPAGFSAPARVALADSLFRCQDDLAFDVPTDEDQLPMQLLQGGARRLSQGDYSWLMTVVPDMMLAQAGNATEVPHRVSVAVFYKRILARPADGVAAEGERLAKVDTSAPAGTGELTLTTAGVTALTADPSKHLDIAKPGQWLMIAGFVNVDHDNDSSTAPISIWNYHWFRVISAADIVPSGSNYTRAVTLAGPDWTVPIGNVTVYLFDGIVNVYEQTLKLETESMY
jgi:hypothetical protein